MEKLIPKAIAFWDKLLMKMNKYNLYYIFVTIITLVFYMRYFKFEYKVIDYIVYSLAAISMLIYGCYWICENFTIKERLIHIILLSIIFCIYYLTGMKYEYLIFTLLAIIGTKNKSMKKIMKIIFLVYFTCLIMHVILLTTGIIKNEVFVKISSGKKVTTNLYGFSHGNTAFTILFTLICSLVYYKFDKIKIWHLAIIEIASILLYFIFYARTGLVIITLFLIGTVLFKLIKRKNNIILKIFRTIETVIVPTMFIGTYLLSTVFFETKVANIVNKIVSDRLKISNIYYDIIPLNLFPNNFEFVKNLPLDNMYSFIICSFGVLFTVATMIIFVVLYIKLLKKKRYFEMFIITLFALYSYAETMYINAFKNPSILFIGIILYKNFSMFDCEEKE